MVVVYVEIGIRRGAGKLSKVGTTKIVAWQMQ
jgi:hypothetical protein